MMCSSETRHGYLEVLSTWESGCEKQEDRGLGTQDAAV